MIISPRPITRRRAASAATLLVLTMLTTAGCSGEKQLQAMPTLADVTPTGPKGKKCFEYCAQSEVSCKHICPKVEGLCQEDCVTDTKHCLHDCPELRNNNPSKSWPEK